jgi:acetyl-CoA C-acetyltransferase
MRKVFITGSVRTAIGDLNGSLVDLDAVTLGKIAAAESLKRAGIEAGFIDEVIFGNILQAGLGQNPARQISIDINIPIETPAFTVNKVCGSGMKAIELGWQSILLNRAQAVLAGGIESMSQAPHILPSMRRGIKLGDGTVLDTVICDGLTDVFGQYHMGITAENVAEKYSISRNEQDQFALTSHQKCVEAMESGLWMQEIVPVRITKKKGEIIIDKDEHPRPDTSLEKLAKLRPVFKKDGTVTAGNASGINDGAASVVLVAEETQLADNINKSGAAYLRDIAVSGCAPEVMGLGPIGAVNKLLNKNGLSIDDIDLWELNEAFAAQSIAVIRDLKIDPQKINVNGGAIALGHPIGASGARIIVTLIHQMKRQNANLGVAAMCIGGGMGIASLIENI